ncbi:MAG: hypothetical protein JO359_09445 [Candidatus Eremiobacteraeota bacterium]|nr:hypothetical protein [Candidatus Eremiobacteraeota bacterium]
MKLVVVGTGIKLGQALPKVVLEMQQAQKLLYLVAHPITATWLRQLNRNAESLSRFYASGKRRSESYEEMAQHTLSFLKRGKSVCLALNGHPGIAAKMPRLALRRAREAGFETELHPGVSFLDCLASDLGIDPVERGISIFDATDFLKRRRQPDTSTDLVLLQPAVAGSDDCTPNPEGLRLLASRLADAYGSDYEVVLYEAAVLPMIQAEIAKVPLRELASADLSAATTLYAPALTG